MDAHNLPALPQILVTVQGRLPAPLPCPWCGGTVVVVEGDTAANWLRCATATCRACGPGAGTPTEALYQWNMREQRVHIRPVGHAAAC